ncbi:hypothetical protein OXX79_010678 [Metschnikowia pulcherrima]
MTAPTESLLSRINDVLTKKRSRMLSVTVKTLAFLEYRETSSGSNETPSSSDDGEESEESEESDESDELDEMDEEMNGEMDGDSCDAARTSRGKNPAAVDIVI